MTDSAKPPCYRPASLLPSKTFSRAEPSPWGVLKILGDAECVQLLGKTWSQKKLVHSFIH